MASKRTLKSGKQKKVMERAPAEKEAQPPLENFVEKYWPEQLASPRTAILLAALCILLAAIVFGAALLGSFSAMKLSLAHWLELTSPQMVSTANFDVAFVIFGIGATVLLGMIHPCIGICLLLLCRPWLDGYTFFADNVYFTWSIFLLIILWMLRVIKRGERILTPPPILMLTALLVVMFAVTPYSYQFYNSYQHLWLWMGYVGLFFLTINVVRDRATWGIVVTIFLLTMGMQAAFSILHLEYLLPHLRRVIQDPAVLQRYFNTTVISPELARRFEVNRAFGTMLFPPSLAAYLLLGIPIVLAGFAPWWRDAIETLQRGRPTPSEGMKPADRVILLGVAIIIGIGCFAAIMAITFFPREYRDELVPLPFYLQTAPLAVFAFICGCAVALGAIMVISRYGLDGLWYLGRMGAVFALVPILLYTLWITYARGAYLGLFIAGIWCFLLWVIPPAQTKRWFSMFSNRANVARTLLLVGVVVAIAAFVADLGDASSYAQGVENAAPQRPQQGMVRQEGLTLSATDLADPASLRLRFGYWRVALRMIRDNLLTGVGLGNFGIAYPAYQYIGAGDVRDAHNGFLQTFAETGVFGGLLLTSFWIYFGLWGAWRILKEENRNEKLFLLGIYGGVVAFGLHAVLDINFSHPSLMMCAMVYSGLFYARAAVAAPKECADDQQETEDNNGGIERYFAVFHRIAAVTLIVLLTVCAGATLRVYAQQLVLSRFNFLNVANNGEMDRRMRTGQFFISEVTHFARALGRGEKPANNPRILIAQARLFLDDFASIADSFVFYKRSPDLRTRFLRVESGEPIPDDGLMVLAGRPYRVRSQAVENIADWVEELIKIDSWFPHSHDLAVNILKWYEMHVYYVYGPLFEEARAGWINEYLKWGHIVASRNPRHADARMLYAQALYWNILHNPNADGDKLVEIAGEQWQEILALAPISPVHWHACIWFFSGLRDYYSGKGDDARAAIWHEKAEALRREVLDIEKRRAEVFLYP